jgi:hypothetical protein
MQCFELEIFADYFQFYIQDDNESVGDLSEAWTEEAVLKKLAITDGALGIGTARNMDVHVTVNIQESKQVIDESDYDLVNEATITSNTGKLVIAGCTDYFPDATRISVSVGKYIVQMGYKNLTDISEDGLDGNDRYHLWLSPCT